MIASRIIDKALSEVTSTITNCFQRSVFAANKNEMRFLRKNEGDFWILLLSDVYQLNIFESNKHTVFQDYVQVDDGIFSD